MTQLKPGTVFAGRFRVERLLGRGGMGAVYEALDGDGTRVALKVISIQLAGDEKQLVRFRDEALLTHAIDHPNVVRVFEAGIDEATDTPWITMEYLEGESLRSLVKARGALDRRTGALILSQVARALGAAHGLGVVHRDIKPDNVFVAHEANGGLTAKVLDFGIAKLANDVSTRTTGLVGSPLWFPPEEAKKEPLTVASDIWQFGLLAYYVLVGRSVWVAGGQGGSIAAVLNELLIEPLPNPSFGQAPSVWRCPKVSIGGSRDAWSAIRPRATAASPSRGRSSRSSFAQRRCGPTRRRRAHQRLQRFDCRGRQNPGRSLRCAPCTSSRGSRPPFSWGAPCLSCSVAGPESSRWRGRRRPRHPRRPPP